MKFSKTRPLFALAGGLISLGGLLLLNVGVISAQEPSARERELTQIVEELLQRVEELERRVGTSGNSESDSEKEESMEVRVDALETKIETVGVPSENSMRVHWNEGLRFDSRNGDFRLKLGGRIQNDWAFFDEDDELRNVFGDNDDGTEFRRARLYLSGRVYRNFEFKVQYDFAGGDADFNDVWMAANDIPYVGQLKIGHFKEPFSLEVMTSSKYGTFLERSLPVVFAPGRNTGMQLMNNHFDQRMTWAVGVFREVGSFGDGADDGGYNWTGRITGLPWYKEEGRKLLHVGAAYSVRNPDGTIRYRQRPEVHITDIRYVDTQMFQADDVDLYNLEAAFVYGPFSLQGEYYHAEVETDFGGDPSFDGQYLQASYFLTGENRRYSKGSGAFTRTRPNRNFNWGENRGPGAWELAVRYSSIDLDSGFINGGKEDNYTLAVNWYLNPNMRVMLNYIHGDIDHVLYDGDLEALSARFQIDF